MAHGMNPDVIDHFRNGEGAMICKKDEVLKHMLNSTCELHTYVRM